MARGDVEMLYAKILEQVEIGLKSKRIDEAVYVVLQTGQVAKLDVRNTTDRVAAVASLMAGVKINAVRAVGAAIPRHEVDDTPLEDILSEVLPAKLNPSARHSVSIAVSELSQDEWKSAVYYVRDWALFGPFEDGISTPLHTIMASVKSQGGRND